MLIKPVTALVDNQGHALLIIQHSLHGLVWKVYQIGFALGQQAVAAQVAAHVNGVPLAATIPMQVSVFSNFPTQAPYAMESFMTGPPYINLEAGDQIVVGLIGGVTGDTFTAAAYVDELDRRLGRAQDMGR